MCNIRDKDSGLSMRLQHLRAHTHTHSLTHTHTHTEQKRVRSYIPAHTPPDAQRGARMQHACSEKPAKRGYGRMRHCACGGSMREWPRAAYAYVTTVPHAPAMLACGTRHASCFMCASSMMPAAACAALPLPLSPSMRCVHTPACLSQHGALRARV